MALNFTPNLFQDTFSIPSTSDNLDEIFKTIPTSDKLIGIEVRLSKILIIDNKQPYIPWIVRYSDLYLLLAVVDDLGGPPQTINISGFADIDDNEELPVDRTAYHWETEDKKAKAPGQIHLVTSIIKSNDGVRNTGAALQELQKSNDYKTIIEQIVKTVATGGTSLISDGLIAVTGLLGSVLGKTDDTPLITTVMSFTGISGAFDQLGRHPIVRKNRYAEIETTLIIRDYSREQKT
jgi:hypothetical protein